VRGFLVGSLTLIVIYVVTKPGSTEKLVSGNNALLTMFRRVLDGGVAGVPDKSFKGSLSKSSTTSSKSSIVTV
jgi:hypothetical protein